MSLRLGVVMDPIAAIKPYKDTTFAMLLEAERRGYEVRYLELSDLHLDSGTAVGHSRPLEVRDGAADWFRLGEGEEHPLAELDVILMRKDPPADAEYLYATHILEAAQRAGALVLNSPRGLRDAQEKLTAALFPECCPPTLVTRDPHRAREFVAEHRRAVLKPLYGMGGESIFVAAADDPNLSVILETLSARGSCYFMAQRYLPEIRDGDKRILLIDGKPVPYALARIPAAGETRGNIAAGGRGQGVQLSDRDRWICAQVAPALAERGLVFVGLDVIGDYLTEVNVTSPTCVRELDAQYGINIGATFFDVIEQRVGR